VEPSLGVVAPSEVVSRGGQRSRMGFVVVTDGVERMFWSLREARVAADEAGVVVTARRMVVG